MYNKNNPVCLLGFVCVQGCRMPLVVKPADTQKDKEIKTKHKKSIEGGQNSSPYMSVGREISVKCNCQT